MRTSTTHCPCCGAFWTGCVCWANAMLGQPMQSCNPEAHGREGYGFPEDGPDELTRLREQNRQYVKRIRSLESALIALRPKLEPLSAEEWVDAVLALVDGGEVTE